MEHPISIFDDQEEKTQKGIIIENARNADLLSKAYLCNDSLEIVFAITKMKFRGTLAQKDLGLKNELIQYFNSKLNLDFETEHFMPRLEAEQP